MSAWIPALLQRQRLLWLMVALATLVGIASWFTMPRQEDPSFEERFATVLVPYPGTDASTVERLVVERLEEALAEVDDLKPVIASARPGVAILQLQLEDHVYETDRYWDDVQDALDRAAGELPAQAGPVTLDTRIGAPESVVLLVTGSDDRLELRRAAQQVRLSLLSIDGVSEVRWIADPGARLAVHIDPAMAQRLGLDGRMLAQQLQRHNVTLPGGDLVLDGRSIALLPKGELSTAAELSALPVLLPDGSSVSLGAVATVEEEPLPTSERILHRGAPAVGLSIVPERPLDLVALGERTDAGIERARRAIAPLTLEVMAAQPAMVKDRIRSLSMSLLMGVGIVALSLMLFMGPRLGLVVSSVVPLVTFTTVAIYAGNGGVLHQISIAALVLALGLLVDNAIVMAESVQHHLDQGATGPKAAILAVQELAFPLATATGTTLAALAPMLLSGGGTADFTRAIPVLLSMALVISYLYAITVTPSLAGWVLRPQPASEGPSRLEAFAARVAALPLRAPARVLGATALLLGLAGASSLWVQQSFFPLSDRAKVVVSVALPEGSDIGATESLAGELTERLEAMPRVQAVTSFIGRGAPRFYYNLNNDPSAPHSATLVVSTREKADVPDTLAQVALLARSFPEASIVAKPLQQGPPVGSPVELRVQGQDLQQLSEVATELTRALRQVPGTRDVRHDLGLGMPALRYAVDDYRLAQARSGRDDVALTLMSQTTGVPAGRFYGSFKPQPIVVANGVGRQSAPDAVANAPLMTRAGAVPLSQVALADLSWTPAEIRRRGGQRMVTVRAELEPGTTFGTVKAAMNNLLDAPDGVTLSWGGEAEGSEQANGAILSTLPIGLGLLMFFLLVQFDSLRRVGIVLTTVPLAAVGVMPGLALTGQPFGFMSLLGVIALVGIVVNNAIVLLDVVEERRQAGASIDEALQAAVQLRLRPILLTTVTTVSGMLPLAFSSSSLWPPLAWAMISGLLASTGLTLVVVPALYRLLFPWPQLPFRRFAPSVAVAVALMSAMPAWAGPMTLTEVLDAARQAPAVQAAGHGADGTKLDATTAWLGAVAPAVGGGSTLTWRDDIVGIDTPIGTVPQLVDQQAEAGVQADLPVLNPGALAQAHMASAAVRAAGAGRDEALRQTRIAVAHQYLDLLALDARIEATRALEEGLRGLVNDMQARSDAELVTPADVLRAQVALADARQGLLALEQGREVAAWGLAATLGLDEPVHPSATALPDARDGKRADLAQQEALLVLSRRARGVAFAEMLPTASLVGSWSWTDNDALNRDNWLTGQVVLQWTPLARGTRLSRQAAERARVRQAEDQLDALQRRINVEVKRAEADQRVAVQAIETRTQAFDQALEALRITSDRYEQGLATLTDVLQVHAAAADQQAARQIAKVDQVRAQVALRAARGQL